MSEKHEKDEQKPKEPMKDVTGKKVTEEELKNVAGGLRGGDCNNNQSEVLKAK